MTKDLVKNTFRCSMGVKARKKSRNKDMEATYSRKENENEPKIKQVCWGKAGALFCLMGKVAHLC